MNKLECILMGIEIGYRWAKAEASMPPPAPVDPDFVMDVCCRYFSVSRQLMTMKTRQQVIVQPRQIAMYLLTELTDVKLTALGRMFSKDHSTVIHARDLITELMNQDEIIRGQVRYLRSVIMDAVLNEREPVIEPLPAPKLRGPVANRVRPFKHKFPRKIKDVLKRKPEPQTATVPFTRPAATYSNSSPYKIASGG